MKAIHLVAGGNPDTHSNAPFKVDDPYRARVFAGLRGPARQRVAIVPEPSGDAMWFTEEAGHKVSRIDMDGNIREFPLPNLVKIDKAMLRGASDSLNVPITYYAVPTRETVMHRIILGPDGNMWFTEMNADKIGKLITSSK
jgi:streptogramin lyase